MGEIVDIIIPVYNGRPYIETALKSCFGQTHPEFRITVIDNASSDGTADWIERAYGGDPRLRLIRNPSNIGMAANIRKCFENVALPYHCFLCADDCFLSPHALEEALDILRENPSVGAVFSDLAYIDAKDRVMANRRFRRSGIFDGRLVGRNSILQTRNLFGIPVLVRSAWLKNTKPDESLSYTWDVDFAIRLAQKAHLYHIPKPLLGNRYHKQNASRTLHRFARIQFFEVARRNGYRLSRAEVVIMNFLAVKNGLLRLAFLIYAKIRAADCINKSENGVFFKG